MAPQHLNVQDILAELEGHNSFFDDLVDMIPAKLYVAGNSGDDAYNPKFDSSLQNVSIDLSLSLKAHIILLND